MISSGATCNRRLTHDKRRFKLISFPEIADWIARKPGSIARDEDLRRQAYADLLKSFEDGDFGPDQSLWVLITPDSGMPGPFLLRLDRAGAIGPGIHPETRELCITREAANQWLTARDLRSLPPAVYSSSGWSVAKDGTRTRIGSNTVASTQKIRQPKEKVAQSKLTADFNQWADALAEWPTQKEANAWAKENGYSSTKVRSLQSERNARQRGERKKQD